MFRVQAFLMVLFLVVVSCTKTQPPKPALEQVKKAVGDLNRVVFETELILPAKYKRKVKKTDLILWDLKDASGDFLVGDMRPVAEFPMHVKVLGKDLKKDVAPDAELVFSARIVAYGDEGKPPKKDQLYSIVGSTSQGGELIQPPKGVKSAALAKIESNFSHIQFKKVTIGSQIQAQFGLSVF